MKKFTWIITGECEGHSHTNNYIGTLQEFLSYFGDLISLYPQNTYTIKTKE